MENRKLLALTIWTVVGSYVAFLMMCTATFTNQWIYTREVMKTINDTGTEVREIRQHSGLLVACQMVGKYAGLPFSYTPSRPNFPLNLAKCLLAMLNSLANEDARYAKMVRYYQLRFFLLSTKRL